MTKFLANFLIADPITINDFRVSMPLAFAGLFTDLILYTASFMGFPSRRLRLSQQQCRGTCFMMVRPSMHHPPEFVPFGNFQYFFRTTLRASGMCIARYITWDLTSRYSSWPKLLRTTAYLVLSIVIVFSIDSKNPQANTAILLSEVIQNAKRF